MRLLHGQQAGGNGVLPNTQFGREAEPGESYMGLQRRLQEEAILDGLADRRREPCQDPTSWVIRSRLQDQIERTPPAVLAAMMYEDTASTKWKERAEKGHKTETDTDQQFHDDAISC